MELETRPLVASDKQQMQSLCRECFPIDYPDRWFDRQLSGDAELLAVGVADKRSNQLVGIIVGQLQPLSDVEGEYGALLNEAGRDDKVMYIVIFGVLERWRRRGIGSHLMGILQAHVNCLPDCKAIYLHVESTNTAAINFYISRGFKLFCRVPGYYTIERNPADGLLYVEYANGGVAYDGTLGSWCRRYIWDSSVCRCLTAAVNKPVDFIKALWNTKK